MPLYEYRCEGCNRLFEALQKFSDAPLTVCEKCGGKVDRLMSAPAFHLKGSGWYITDYARAGAKGEKKSAAETKSETKSETKADTKTESPAKTQTKSDSKPASPAKES